MTHSEVCIVEDDTIKGHTVGGFLNGSKLQKCIVLLLHSCIRPHDNFAFQQMLGMCGTSLVSLNFTSIFPILETRSWSGMSLYSRQELASDTMPL